MAFLGLFSKRDKHKAQDAVPDSASAASDLDPSEPDYVLPSSSKGASLYSVPAASSSKLRLGFRSKKPPPAARTGTNLLSPPSAFQSFTSESEHDLSPPPPRSAVFAGYADPTGAHSTRSLPNNPAAHSHSASKDYADLTSGAPLPPPPKNGKGGSLFSWAHRDRKKSKAPPPPSQFVGVSRPDVSLDSESFNLRSFRHVRPESPNEPPPSMMPPVRPRPRENSFTSDTSQRISVAAFREAQARRSAANSPTPSSATMLSPGTTTGLRPPSTFTMRNSKSISGDSDTEDSDEGDSSAQEATLKPRRNRPTKPPPLVVPGKKSVSELGHTATPTTAPLLPHMAASASANPAMTHSGTSQEAVYARPRASASTSALQPNAAARRASLILAQQVKQPPPPHQRAQPQRQGKPAASPAKPAPKTTRRASSSSSSSSTTSEDSDSDDAPLAQLVGPKRPGSAASSAPSSTSRTRLAPKPLIDIAGMVPPTFPPVFAKVDRPPVPSKDSPQPSLIAPSPKVSIPSPGHASKPSVNDRLARLTKGAPTSPELPDKPGYRTRATPTRSQTQPVELLSLPPKPSDDVPIAAMAPAPLRLVNGRSMSSPNATFEDPKAPSESSPIVPIPIRTRTPPPTFAVTSRPSSQFSQNQQSDPDPRVSEETVRVRQSVSTLLSDGDFASNKGFTGGGLLAGGSPVSQGTPTPASRGRQRASTLIATPSASATQFPSAAPTGPSSRSNARMSQDLSSRPNARVVQDPSPGRTVRISQDPPPRLVARSASPDSSKSAVTSDTPSSRTHRSTFKPKSALKNSTQSSPVASSSSRQAALDSLTAPPPKPFAGATYKVALRGNSPASSTGDSSSGRTPITPVDGSEIRAASLARKRGHRKSSSAALDEASRGRLALREQDKGETSDPGESRRRERRRSEAKAAIELGKIVNGRSPIATDDDDEGSPMNMGPRMGMFNPMMGSGSGVGMSPMASPPMAWNSPPATPGGMMNTPMFPMMSPSADPMLVAAHQQAMMVAKQAFQMAYAQQALAAANEEWERGSTAASVYGGGGMGGMGGMPSMPSMGGMGGMGGGLMPGMMPWGMQMFPSSQSMYAGSVIGGSQIGEASMAGGRGAGWGSHTTYGAQGGYTGTAAQRASAVYRNSQFLANGLGMPGARSEIGGPSAANGRAQPRQRTKTGPESPQQSPGTPGKRSGPPPSSWNARSKPM